MCECEYVFAKLENELDYGMAYDIVGANANFKYEPVQVTRISLFYFDFSHNF